MPDSWYYTQDGKTKIGPVPFSVLQQLASSGVLQPTYMVFHHDGDNRWVQAKSVLRFFPEAALQPALTKSAGLPVAVVTQPMPVQTQSTYCRNCGKPVALNAAFCISCGVVPMNSGNFCQNCGNQTSAAQVVCVKCGVALGKEKTSTGKGKAIFFGLNQNGLILFFILLLVFFPAAIIPFLIPAFKGEA